MGFHGLINLSPPPPAYPTSSETHLLPAWSSPAWGAGWAPSVSCPGRRQVALGKGHGGPAELYQPASWSVTQGPGQRTGG